MRRGIPSVMLSRALLSAAFGAGIAYVPLLVVTEYHQTLLVAGGLGRLETAGRQHMVPQAVTVLQQDQVLSLHGRRRKLQLVGEGMIGGNCRQKFVV